MKKVTNKKTKRIASALAALSLVSAMAMPVATISASAAETTAIVEEVSILDNETLLDAEAEGQCYNGHKIIDGTYHHEGSDFTFKYSDGFFEVDPVKYDAHLATMSESMTHASCTEVTNGDYSEGAKKVVDILKQTGFDNKDIYVSDSYRVKPTPDSVACVIASKDIKTQKGSKKLVSITVRSAGYEAEWASNVTLGKEGEAAGFANAANQVMGYLNDFNSDGKLDEALADGDVIFWVQGYSRGGATANLTSKRLIDAYQADGNEVYGYCIAAPQGGVKDAEDPDRNYNSIHNVINPHDLVPYVAPTSMGFKRYGVDHFMFGGEADSDNIKPWSCEFENAADNYDRPIIDMNAQTARMKRQLENIVQGDIDEYLPYEITAKRLDFPNVTSIVDDDSKNYLTGNFINYMLNSIARKVGRETYENEMQAPLRRIMMFLNSDNQLPDFMKEISTSQLIGKVLLNCPKGVFLETEVVSKSKSNNIFRMFIDVWSDILTGSQNTRFVARLSDSSREQLVNTIIETLDKESIMQKFDNYPTVEFDCEISSREAAKRDIKAVLSNALKGVSDINELLTFGLSIEGIFKNHTQIQASAWLRSFDSWYDDISEGGTDDATDTWDDDISGGATGSW